MFVDVTKVRVVVPYTLDLEFSNGVRRRVNLEAELYGTVYLPLRDPVFFAQAYLDKDTLTVTWPNGADFAPEFLLNYAPASEAR